MLTKPRIQTFRGSGGRGTGGWVLIRRHCEERSNEAIRKCLAGLLRCVRDDKCMEQSCKRPNICYAATMFGGGSPSALAARFAAIAQRYINDGAAERTERARRALLGAIGEHEPATLGQVAKAVGRGAPAVSRSVESLVRSGLIERAPDPDNRRRLAMRLTDGGRELIGKHPAAASRLMGRLERLAPSELRAVERAMEILERGG